MLEILLFVFAANAGSLIGIAGMYWVIGCVEDWQGKKSQKRIQALGLPPIPSFTAFVKEPHVNPPTLDL